MSFQAEKICHSEPKAKNLTISMGFFAFQAQNDTMELRFFAFQAQNDTMKLRFFAFQAQNDIFANNNFPYVKIITFLRKILN